MGEENYNPTRVTLLAKLKKTENDEAWLEFETIYRGFIRSLILRMGINADDADTVVLEYTNVTQQAITEGFLQKQMELLGQDRRFDVIGVIDSILPPTRNPTSSPVSTTAPFSFNIPFFFFLKLFIVTITVPFFGVNFKAFDIKFENT